MPRVATEVTKLDTENRRLSSLLENAVDILRPAAKGTDYAVTGLLSSPMLTRNLLIRCYT